MPPNASEDWHRKRRVIGRDSNHFSFWRTKNVEWRGWFSGHWVAVRSMIFIFGEVVRVAACGGSLDERMRIAGLRWREAAARATLTSRRWTISDKIYLWGWKLNVKKQFQRIEHWKYRDTVSYGEKFNKVHWKLNWMKCYFCVTFVLHFEVVWTVCSMKNVTLPRKTPQKCNIAFRK